MTYSGIHEVIYGGGDQPLVHVPTIPVDGGTASYVVEDVLEAASSSSRTIVASGAATVDSFSATTTADAGPEEADHQRIAVDDETGATAGRFYALVSPEGVVEVFRCSGVDTGVILADAPLGHRRFASGSTVAGIELRGTFPSASAASETLYEQDRPIRCVWTYAIRGVQVRAVQQVRVARAKVTDANAAMVIHDLRRFWPELVQEYSGSLQDLVEYASRRVVMRLRKRHVDVGQLMLGDTLHEAILARAVFHLADQGIVPRGRDADEFREQMKAKYMDDLSMLASGRAPLGQVEVDRSSDQAPASHSKRWISIVTRP